MFDGIDLKNLNLGDMLNQFQNMAQNAKEENSSRIFTSKAGGGMIEISINGNSEVIDLKIELIKKQKIYFECLFNEWSILQYELKQNEIEYQESYTAEGIQVNALAQVHQIEPLANKIQDLTRGREKLKIIEEPNDD